MLTAEDYKYIEMAEEAAKEATCGILYVGCVIVKDGRVVSTGCNAAVKGHKPCSEAGHLMSEDGSRCMRQVHAETNAILNADKNDLAGATAYVTLEPCDNCTKIMNQCGIARVIFKTKYPNPYNTYFIEPMEWICLEEL